MKEKRHVIRSSCREFGSVQMVALCGILLALRVVLGFLEINIESVYRISFAALPVSLGAVRPHRGRRTRRLGGYRNTHHQTDWRNQPGYYFKQGAFRLFNGPYPLQAPGKPKTHDFCLHRDNRFLRPYHYDSEPVLDVRHAA